MSATAPFVAMARNNAWANETLLAAVVGLGREGFAAPRPGFFPSLAGTLNHLLLVDRYYLAALEGWAVPYEQVDASEIGDPAALAEAQVREDLRLLSFCEALTPSALSDTRATIREAGSIDERVEALLLHLFQHQIHHRGQAHIQLSHAGVAPPQLDDFHLAHGRAPSAERWQRC